MRLIILLAVIGISGATWAQTLPKEFANIKVGTSEVDVIKQLGEPKRIENFVTVRNNSFDTTRYWRYEKDIIIVFTNHAVESVEPKWDVLLKKIQLKANRKDQDGITIINGE